ncbi:type II toxin-antitoxin system PemK/MazF family toxin [Rhizohabitans arisaemae]|uniref:type II toxin-antitoxin system PemK/MazF family toxin n=1 Tax=Rhizohabitans arisaemae TaxID=2720610 RepID=UPI0024B151F8|nr:type II toxin-antitoxin system PemK/MazF family toxin [Rhizohabitans arisaemae]
MEAGVLPLLVAAIALTALGILVFFLRRVSAGFRPRLHAQPPSDWRGRPAPGQIWFAEVPFEEGGGAKDRPCLVLRTHARSAEVLKITSRNQNSAHSHKLIPISSTGWNSRSHGGTSWVDVSRSYHLPATAFRRLAARECDPKTWAQVRRRHPVGWVYRHGSGFQAD